MLRNSEHDWGIVAKALHWLVAIAILGQFVLGQVAEDLRVSPQKIELFVWHKSIGLSILLLVIIRIAWRTVNAPPRTPGGIDMWEQRLARAGHLLLYLLMLAVPLTGWWIADTSRIPFKLFRLVSVPDFMEADRDASELAAGVHGSLATLLIIVVAGHVMAALRHHFLLRNETLVRMLPFGRHYKEPE